ncbi:hypothetical protein A4G21_08020 [Brucella intermedia]|nr:hypothetical protein A4G21_08020 [Brucella intermedia]
MIIGASAPKYKQPLEMKLVAVFPIGTNVVVKVPGNASVMRVALTASRKTPHTRNLRPSDHFTQDEKGSTG